MTPLEPEFKERSPHDVTQACDRIELLIGNRREETQIRKFFETETPTSLAKSRGDRYAAEEIS